MNSQRLFADVAQRIIHIIQSQGLQVGEKLPSEAELATQLKVSRPTLREAIVALEVMGIVAVRKNAGAFVCATEVPSQIAVTFGDESGPFEQLEARLAMEPHAAYLAAQRRPDSLPRELEATIIHMLKEHEDGFRTETGDRDFHLLIAGACGNLMIEEMVTQMWKMRERGQLWPELQKRVRIGDARSRAVYEHMRIADAIKRQDADAAKLEMEKHLYGVMESLEEAFPK